MAFRPDTHIMHSVATHDITTETSVTGHWADPQQGSEIPTAKTLGSEVPRIESWKYIP